MRSAHRRRQQWSIATFLVRRKVVKGDVRNVHAAEARACAQRRRICVRGARHLHSLLQALADTQDKVRQLRAARKSSVIDEIICTSSTVAGEPGEVRFGLSALRQAICQATRFNQVLDVKAEGLLETPMDEPSGLESLNAAMNIAKRRRR